MGTPPSVTRVRFRSLVPIYFIARPANWPNTKAAASVTSVRRRHGRETYHTGRTDNYVRGPDTHTVRERRIPSPHRHTASKSVRTNRRMESKDARIHVTLPSPTVERGAAFSFDRCTARIRGLTTTTVSRRHYRTRPTYSRSARIYCRTIRPRKRPSYARTLTYNGQFRRIRKIRGFFTQYNYRRAARGSGRRNMPIYTYIL